MPRTKMVLSKLGFLDQGRDSNKFCLSTGTTVSREGGCVSKDPQDKLDSYSAAFVQPSLTVQVTVRASGEYATTI
jgi:hypothetical protein